jgi:hypothetical protein
MAALGETTLPGMSRFANLRVISLDEGRARRSHDGRIRLIAETCRFPTGVPKQRSFANIPDVSTMHTELHDSLALSGQCRPPRLRFGVLFDPFDLQALVREQDHAKALAPSRGNPMLLAA